MTLSLYIQCVAMLILGQAIQVFLIKIPDIKKNAKIAGQSFIWKDWWASDWNLVVGTALIGAVVMLGLKELINWKPEILEFVKWFFAALGGFGSNFVMAKWSKYQAYFDGVQLDKTITANKANADAAAQK